MDLASNQTISRYIRTFCWQKLSSVYLHSMFWNWRTITNRCTRVKNKVTWSISIHLVSYHALVVNQVSQVTFTNYLIVLIHHPKSFIITSIMTNFLKVSQMWPEYSTNILHLTKKFYSNPRFLKNMCGFEWGDYFETRQCV